MASHNFQFIAKENFYVLNNFCDHTVNEDVHKPKFNEPSLNLKMLLWKRLINFIFIVMLLVDNCSHYFVVYSFPFGN